MIAMNRDSIVFVSSVRTGRNDEGRRAKKRMTDENGRIPWRHFSFVGNTAVFQRGRFVRNKVQVSRASRSGWRVDAEKVVGRPDQERKLMV